jgi:hypothetical protein
MRCGSEQTRKDGQTRVGGAQWRCNDRGRRFTVRSTSVFATHGFPDDVIALAVRWYVRYRLSYADVVERGLSQYRSIVTGIGNPGTMGLRIGASTACLHRRREAGFLIPDLPSAHTFLAILLGA